MDLKSLRSANEPKSAFLRTSVAWLSRFGVVCILLTGGRADAVSYLQEGFNYPSGTLGTNAPWTGPTNLISVTTNRMSYLNLPDFSPPANAVTVSAGSKSVTYRPLTTPATNGCVYFSFLIDFTTVPGNYYIAGLTQSTNASPGGATDDPLDLIDGVGGSGAGAQLGVRAMGGSSFYLTNGSSYLATNTTYFVVMKYNFTNGGSSLFLNPPVGNTEPAVPDASSVATNNEVVSNLSYVYLRVGSSTAGDFMISALRVASTWAEVTPATNTATAYSNAAMLSSFLNSLQVGNFWIEGTSVNWLTGVAGSYSSGPNMTIGSDSHCSAFAGAVTDLLGIYLLRQPYASDLNLANNQAIWLSTNTTYGWFPITSMTSAQHYANAGTLVVASYLNPSNPTNSGHIAVLLPSNRTDASVNAYGPEECQSGDYNFADTNVVTGFNQHPDAFPSNILYYGHSVTYPINATYPVFTNCSVSNRVFKAKFATVIGRTYQVLSSSNLTTWTPVLTFTNSDNSTNFYTNTVFTNALATNPPAAQQFFRVLAQ